MALDLDVRLHVYDRFVGSGGPPTPAETAAALGVVVAEVEAAYRRLAEQRVLVLHPGTLHIWMAMPFSSAPTAFRVEAGGRAWWANCAWDALGIPAALGEDAAISSRCPDCEEPLRLEVADARPPEASWLVHFAVPASRWWEDIGFT